MKILILPTVLVIVLASLALFAERIGGYDVSNPTGYLLYVVLLTLGILLMVIIASVLGARILKNGKHD